MGLLTTTAIKTAGLCTNLSFFEGPLSYSRNKDINLDIRAIEGSALHIPTHSHLGRFLILGLLWPPPLAKSVQSNFRYPLITLPPELVDRMRGTG